MPLSKAVGGIKSKYWSGSPNDPVLCR